MTASESQASQNPTSPAAPAAADGDGRLAVALSYQPEKAEAPIVRAKGSGHIAEQIFETARAHGVPVQQDSDLVELLSCMDLDTVIPVEAFVAVAEILSYLYRLNGMPKGLMQPAPNVTTGENK